MGVGAVKRFSGMKWTVVERIIWTWLFTLPASGLMAMRSRGPPHALICLSS